jgi:putative ABC transport system ATP-binding protein
MTAPATTTSGAVEARDVTVRRAGRAILDAVSLRAAAGAVLAVTGPSGSGKSTLLAVLAGMVRPDAGGVGLPPDATTGLVLQSHGLVAVLTAAENVELALQLRGTPPAETGERAAEALSRVGLDAVGDRLVDELSGGQQQRVAIARALVVRPDVLLADEPTAELDAVSRALVVGLLREEADRGAVVVVASHDPEVTDPCDTRVRLSDGRVAAAED